MWKIEGIGETISSTLQKIEACIGLFPTEISKLFSNLGGYLVRTKEYLMMSYVHEEWDYVIDPDTNMEVLSVEKDAEALNKIDEIIEELYK